MAKINIPFYGKDYSIDESTLASVSTNLQLHLSTNMNGNGAVINLGGTAYSIDSAKLLAATDGFTSHLGTISGSGSEVVVDGVGYSIDSAKMSDAADSLHTRLSNLQNGNIGPGEGDGPAINVVPGLYETSTNYTVMVKSWDELVSDGTIHISDGALSTNYKSGTLNNSSSALSGDLILPTDNSVTTIAKNAFRACKKLTGVVINQPITYIGMYGFQDCTSLTSVQFPDSLTGISQDAFYNCTALQKVTISNLSRWCEMSLSGSYNSPISYSHNLYLGENEITELITPNDITMIGMWVFNNCNCLTSIVITGNVEYIEDYAFYGCTGVTSIDIREGVEEIYGNAFNSCSACKSVTIPASVTLIGSYAFDYCTSLETINYNGTMEQWAKINIGDNWTDVPATQVICSDGTVTL